MAYKYNVCIVRSIFVIIVYVAWRNQFRSDVCTTAKRIFVSNIPCVYFVFISFFSHFMFESLGFYVWVLCESVKLRMFHRYQECGLIPNQIESNNKIFAIEDGERNEIPSVRWWFRMSVLTMFHVSNEISRFLIKCLKTLFTLHVNAINTIYIHLLSDTT